MAGHGLVLGKFAPLHRGHQYLIDTALAECGAVTALIYDCPETTEVPLPVRSRWLRELYPGLEVLECWDGPLTMGDTPQIQRLHEDYIRRRLGGRKITHFYSSEFYGDHVSRALGAVDRRLDPARARFPVSATMIRDNPFAHRTMLHPRVYRDLVANVVLLGAPATGKTTLAARLAQEYRAAWMPEYGREYWETHQQDRRLTPAQLVEIAEGHLAREEAKLAGADRYLFTDTNALTTYIFALDYHGCAHPRLAELALQAQSRYDLIFLCADDIPFDDTWDRSGPGQRTVFQKRIRADLAERRLPYVELRGSLAARVARVGEVLGRFHKFANPLALAPLP